MTKREKKAAALLRQQKQALAHDGPWPGPRGNLRSTAVKMAVSPMIFVYCLSYFSNIYCDPLSLPTRLYFTYNINVSVLFFFLSFVVHSVKRSKHYF